MSTKSTIAYGDNFHFYHEACDDDHVYLELEGMEFEAGHGRVMVSIPMHIWETIRPLGGARLELVNHTDEDLLAMVEADVDERIARYEELLRENADRAGFASLCGLFVYGGADDPREEQIKSGMEHHRRERERQRTTLAAIKELREAQSRTAKVLLNLDERKIAAELLIMLIEHLSEQYCAAGWSREMETRLWEAATGSDDKFKREGEQARYLSEKCHGWAVWDEVTGKPKLIALREWEGIYYKQLAKRVEEGGGK
ncbi:MAG TPA: hypothetical protein VGB07_02745 [Blastocatellia bacterium]